MFNTIWKIRREGDGYYRITLDSHSFSYYSYPEQDREWTNDSIEELIKEARTVTQANILAFDHYGKIEEYSNIFFDVDEKVIEEIRHEGEVVAKSSASCLGMVCLFLLFINILFCIF